MRQKGLLILLFMVLLTSCGEYQKLLKSRDPEEKYQAALQYFNQKQYVKSQTLLDDVSSYYKGTERSEDILAYLARSYMGQKAYESATEYYKAYVRNYPKGKYATEAYFQVGHCQYLEAPDPRLDQTVTRNAIEDFTVFVELFPESPYAEQAYQEMNELYERLAQKELYSAKLYYNLGTYLGNNYLSCEITAKNALKNYPSSKYQEDFSWLILQAKYQQMLNSFEEKKLERARDTQDEYYNFITEFPNSKHRKEADRMLTQIRKITKE
ncbi:MAG: outer membrane protein assembly factor BamD [Paludibacteraceae bacterium]|nr:outer membrane protein assembly factor BamD [Paludibacteraceae bacterium]MBQ9296738.1 outer membrane protein assembly factor BamD [Paludibacteraceae bacterium]